jgi:galactokinase
MDANEKTATGTESPLKRKVVEAFAARFGAPPTLGWFAPGRVEVLGNHTDYNEGYVLSAALAQGIVFLLRPAPPGATRGRLLAVDLEREIQFDPARPAPMASAAWANYTLGALHFLSEQIARALRPFDAAFGGDLPVGAGLSSSAALAVASTLALAELHGIELSRLDAARIAQRAEHEFAGVRCGLLDQISSLFGAEGALVFTDFRTLDVRTAALPATVEFLLCNTGVKHRLVDSAYNQRRAACERAVAHFAARLSHPVRALRDVSMTEWEDYRHGLDAEDARRAAHVIGENDRVRAGVERLAANDAAGFGALMNASHESSRRLFENSCPELDFCVEAFRHAGALGARLSGGGFGGSVIALAEASRAEDIARTVAKEAERRFRRPTPVHGFRPAGGARRLEI